MVHYVELGDYCRIAAEVLGIEPEQVAAFPTLIEKAAILVERLARNHPLPDGNKRCAFLALERFLAVNDQPIPDPNPEVDVPMMEHIAAGKATQDEIIAWLERRTAT